MFELQVIGVMLAGVLAVMLGIVYGRGEWQSLESACHEAVGWGGAFLLSFGLEMLVMMRA